MVHIRMELEFWICFLQSDLLFSHDDKAQLYQHGGDLQQGSGNV